MENTNKYNTGEQNKIYILGGKGVGKTNLFHLIFSEQFKENMEPSKPGIIKCNLKRGNKELTIKELTDDESFSTTKLLESELEEVILIFIIFGLDDKKSFEYAKTLIQFIKNNLINNKELNIILLGNKKDIDTEDIQVKKKEIDQYIYNIENLYYYEISLKTNYNFTKIKELIDEIEINDGGNDEDDDKIPEEERKKKVNEAKASSCLIF